MSAVANSVKCCKGCKDTCFTVRDKIVKDAAYAGMVKLSDNSILKNAFLKQGYIKGVLCKDTELDLTRNVEILNKYISIQSESMCLCPDEVLQVVDNILRVADINCCNSSERADLIIDESGYNEWVIQNPDCVVYESWEAAYMGICTQFSFGEVFLQEDPKLIYEIAVTPIENKCDLIYAISEQNNNCEIKADVNISEVESCKIQYEALVKNIQCDLSFDSYVKIIDCGIKPEVVSKLVECGFKLEANIEKKSCDIHIDAKTTITLCDYKFDLNSQNIDCKLASDIFGVNVCR